MVMCQLDDCVGVDDYWYDCVGVGDSAEDCVSTDVVMTAYVDDCWC